jgi:hypothetical protein
MPSAIVWRCFWLRRIATHRTGQAACTNPVSKKTAIRPGNEAGLHQLLAFLFFQQSRILVQYIVVQKSPGFCGVCTAINHAVSSCSA